MNLVSWNGAEPKYDLRDWAPDHEKMGKGITLSPDETPSFTGVWGCSPQQYFATFAILALQKTVKE